MPTCMLVCMYASACLDVCMYATISAQMHDHVYVHASVQSPPPPPDNGAPGLRAVDDFADLYGQAKMHYSKE